MKTLDLNNIKLVRKELSEDNKEMTPAQAGVRWIGVMLERAINKPDAKTGRPTASATLEVQRRYSRVMNVLEVSKDGKVQLETEDFNFLDEKFKEAEIAVQRNVTEILVGIEDALNKAKTNFSHPDKTNPTM